MNHTLLVAGDSLSLPHFFPSPELTSSFSPSNFIVQDFAIIMIVAAIMLIITYKLRQPMVIGYILAGMVIGPYTPPFKLIQNVETVNVFAELGIIMLLFVVGTEFPIAKLKSVGKTSVIVGIPESLGTLIIVFFIAQTLGFSFYDSIFIALAMSITSTVVTIKILEELNILRDRSSVLILGVLIIEDIIAVSSLAILQSTITTGADQVSIIQIMYSIGIVIAFIGGILILGSKIIPGALDRVGKTNDYTLLLIVILGLAFGLSFVASGLGLSVVIGAFLAGVLVAESKTAAIVKVITIPLRDVFSALFFISIGALTDISLIPLFIVPAIVLILSSFASKLLIVIGILQFRRYDYSTSLRTGLGLSSSRGEMSLIIAKGGQDIGAISSSVLPVLSVVTVVTTFMAPYVIKFGNKVKFLSNVEDDRN
jgi:CPA2 family monovalent cation:H+ antiporter-2